MAIRRSLKKKKEERRRRTKERVIDDDESVGWALIKGLHVVWVVVFCT